MYQKQKQKKNTQNPLEVLLVKHDEVIVFSSSKSKGIHICIRYIHLIRRPEQ